MRVVVIGAGICGLAAGRELADAGATVTVIDKAPSVGGRMATLPLGAATLDHGAQFFTVRTPAFGRRVDDWISRGLATTWAHGFVEEDGHPRYVATNGMASLAADLAAPLNVECSTMAFAVRPSTDTRWDVIIDDGTSRPADAVVVTTPLPQSYALLVDAGVDLDDERFRIEYDRTVALLAVLDRSPAIPSPGGVQLTDDPVFAFIGDNAAKGLSEVPAVTFHASSEWSEARWEDGPDDLRVCLVAAAAPWLGDAVVIHAQVARWRFARPRTVHPDPCALVADSVVLGGDAFAGPRVEGAHNSGLACAHALVG